MKVSEESSQTGHGVGGMTNRANTPGKKVGNERVILEY
jgi:hypothetical protein